MNEQDIIILICDNFIKVLKNKLTGIYIHGSVAFNEFNWNKSDIDFIVVIEKNLTKQEKKAIINYIISINKISPPKGLEMSIVKKEYCNPFVYPTPYELHFSKMYFECCLDNVSSFCEKMHGVDRDLATHFMLINKFGITAWGEPKESVFAPVSNDDYLDSIYHDIKDSYHTLKTDPRSTILNLCRTLMYLQNGQLLSKQQGGILARKSLPRKYYYLITNALLDDSKITDFDDAKQFCDYALKIIESKLLIKMV